MESTSIKLREVKDVALYSRKSRGIDEDLSKHLEELEEMCEQNNWRYRVFSEVGTSQDLEYRNAIGDLLKELNDDMFDAVLVIDKDRLSREETGQATINKTLRENDVLIITPSKVYDLNNENDVFISEIEDVMARNEYRKISRRFQRGKKRGAKRGEWTNGPPPYPYKYVPEAKSIRPVPENLKWYNYMKAEVLDGRSVYSIRLEFNTSGIPSPSGGLWHDSVIERMLLDETHLGRIIYNKTNGSAHKNRKTKPLVHNPRDEWIIVKNCHPAVKTMEEHNKLLKIINNRSKRYVRKGKLPLSGLVRCGKCGATMMFNRKENGNHLIKKCQARLVKNNGIQCDNPGGLTSLVIDEINLQLEKFRNDLKKNIRYESRQNSLYKRLNAQIKAKETEIEDESKKLENQKKLAISGYFDSLEEAKEEKSKILNQIKKLKHEVNDLQSQLEEQDKQSTEDQINFIDEFFDIVKNDEITGTDINAAYKKIIDSIIWTRNDEEVEVVINFP